MERKLAFREEFEKQKENIKPGLFLTGPQTAAFAAAKAYRVLIETDKEWTDETDRMIQKLTQITETEAYKTAERYDILSIYTKPKKRRGGEFITR